jgi:putative ABC transport system permease protein
MGKRRADLLFIWNVMLFIQPFAIRKKSQLIHINHFGMFKNNFKIAWRNMLRQKMYTSIKIGGFALGLATCMLISLFIRHELSYDKHYKDGAQLFRLYVEETGESGGKGTAFPAPIAQILKSDFPEVEKAARLIPYVNWFNAGNNLIRRDDQNENTYEEGFVYGDPEILDLFEIPLVYGNRKHALDKPNTIVISKRKADKYFPNQDPTGKVLVLNEDRSTPFMIGGVMENFPATSHLQFDFLITLSGKEFWQGEQTNWCCWNYSPYIKVRPGTDLAQLEKKLMSIKETYYLPYLKERNDQFIHEASKHLFFRMQNVGDIHLHSEGIHDVASRGDIRYVWLFGGVACFILMLACINFINLSTAKSANRAKEVGLRKTVGSLRIYLVRQFLTESVLFSVVSFLLAMAMVRLSLPYFSRLANTSLEIPWSEWWLIPLLLSSAIFIGVLAGIYPSFYLSAFKPIDVLKGSIARGSKSSRLRSAMVVFQFTTSIVLIIGTFIVYRQMNFILNSKIGYDKEQVITLQGANTLGDKRLTFKEELLKFSEVKGVTISDHLPVTGTKRDQNPFWRDGKSKEEAAVGAQKWYVDGDYIKTMGMKLLEGRTFNPDIASDSQAIIINQTMAKEFGFKKPVGQRIQNWETYEIIGVVEDFNWESMKGEIRPVSFVYGTAGSIVAIKVNTADMRGMIESVTKLWEKFMPHQPIRYTFLDDSYTRMYDDVQRMGYIFACFSMLAIIVACLGLFALSSFMVEQRNKEISIRLVLGASVRNIFRLLTQNFVRLVLISFVIAAPIGWYMMRVWLQDYAYKIDITWDVFAIAGIVSVGIALLTISYQSLRAGFTNPASTLRTE